MGSTTLLSLLNIACALAAPSSLDKTLTEKIARSTGVGLEVVYRAVVKHDKVSVVKLVTYTRKRGIGPLEAHYSKLIEQTENRCKMTPPDRVKTCQESIQDFKREREELKQLSMRPLTVETEGDVIYYSVVVLNEHAQNEILAPSFIGLKEKCGPQAPVTCKDQFSKINGVSGALMDLLFVAGGRRPGLRSLASQQETKRISEIATQAEQRLKKVFE